MDSGTYSTFLTLEMDTSRLTNHGNWSRDPQMRSMRVLSVSSYFCSQLFSQLRINFQSRDINISQFKHMDQTLNHGSLISQELEAHSNQLHDRLDTQMIHHCYIVSDDIICLAVNCLLFITGAVLVL